MFSNLPAMKMAQKAVAATVICGAVALGTGGAAFATTTTSTPVTHPHHCARAGKALTKINKAEAALTTRLAKWQAAESKLTAANHTKAAARVEKRITKLQKAQTKAGSLASKIEAKCPTATSS
jgi:ABC-type transport system involved in cytochrome bd biosynthesis fused ATPase/permease subunit